jgi:hypothetical protein
VALTSLHPGGCLELIDSCPRDPLGRSELSRGSVPLVPSQTGANLRPWRLASLHAILLTLKSEVKISLTKSRWLDMSIQPYVYRDIYLLMFFLTANPLAIDQKKAKGGVRKRRTYLR